MLRQIVSTVAVAGALIAAVGSEAVAQTNPCAAKKPAATTLANPCAAKNPEAAKNSEAAMSPSAVPRSAVSTQRAQSNVFAASERSSEFMRDRTGNIIQAP